MRTKRLLARLLTLCMVLSLLPLAEMTALAESNEDDGGGDTSIVVVTPDEDRPIVVDPEDGNVQVDVELPEDFQIIVTMDYPWHGGGTARNPFLIEDAEDLQLLAEGVQQLEGVAKARYRLTNDIDLSSVCGPEVGNWLPIGSDDHPFRGVLDGAGHKISGLYITGSGSGHALFGTSCGYVLNLTVDGTVSGSKYAAGIVAKNCSLLGGCVFKGTVSGINENSSGIGGIAGINGSVVLGCRNDGVVSTGCEMGGVVGCNWGGRLCLCTNKGTVKNSAQERVGGVAGITGYNTRVAYCYNYGTFENVSIPGGIAGEVYNGRVENCVNYAAVSGTSSAGGIAGRIVEGGVVVYCKNYAAVGAKSKVGGICAELVNGSVEDCINSVPVSGETYVGGIAGFSGGTVSGCVNTGEITASVGRVGGIIGRSYTAGTVGCCNLGDVTCTDTSNAKNDSKYGKAGGIIGESIDSSTSACLNSGTISSDIEAGGIAGELWGGEALRCQNLGTVKPYNKRHNFGYGGIVGYADRSKVEDCRNDGTIKGWREKDGAVEYN
ncbi:MAG: hypothetical protein J5449_05660, partial [Oscillospiraceae bacterium]|nr:hypothetical protein [Oscillospiraceae bacterium]